MAHAPGSSSNNWEAEQGWAPIGRSLIGNELGRSAAATKEALFEAFKGKPEPEEDAIRHVTAQALQEFQSLLAGVRSKSRHYKVLGI